MDLYTKEIGEVADTAIEQINGVAENLNAKKDVIASAADAAKEQINDVTDLLSAKTDTMSGSVLAL